MEIYLNREVSTEKSTTSMLTIPEYQFSGMWILEDVVRPLKIKGETAIPAGRYKIELTYSNRFQRTLPLLLNVENYEGVRIHPGNSASNTEGCLLPGFTRKRDRVEYSRSAFELLYSFIEIAIAKKEEVYITVKNPHILPKIANFYSI